MTPHQEPAAMPDAVEIRVTWRRSVVMRITLTTTLVLLVAHIVTSWISQSILPGGGTKQRILGLFNMDHEVSFPTWWSQTLLLVAAALVVVIVVRVRATGVGARWISYWIALAAFLLYASIDEGASIHEIAATPLRRVLNIGDGILANAWVILGLAVVAVLVLVFLRFFLHLPSATRWQFAVALGVYLCGAVGFEMVAALVMTSAAGATPFSVTLLQGSEESLEMLGAILFIRALLTYLMVQQTPPRVDAEPDAPTAL